MADIQELFKDTIAEFMDNGFDAKHNEELGLQPVQPQEQGHGQRVERTQQ